MKKKKPLTINLKLTFPPHYVYMPNGVKTSACVIKLSRIYWIFHPTCSRDFTLEAFYQHSRTWLHIEVLTLFSSSQHGSWGIKC